MVVSYHAIIEELDLGEELDLDLGELDLGELDLGELDLEELDLILSFFPKFETLVFLR